MKRVSKILQAVIILSILTISLHSYAQSKKEVISDDYLKGFMKEGFDMKKILDN